MQTAKFIIDGHEVSATFAPQENQEVVQRVKQILLSAFASKKKFHRRNLYICNTR